MVCVSGERPEPHNWYPQGRTRKPHEPIGRVGPVRLFGSTPTRVANQRHHQMEVGRYDVG
jgi:hypothetical protein